MGIVSQLPSSHLPYTECQPSSLTGSCPTGKTDASYSSCFLCLIVTDLHLPAGVLICSVDALPLLIPVGLLWMQSIPDSIIYGFLFQNTVQSPMPGISDSTRSWIHYAVYFRFLCGYLRRFNFRASNIFQQFLRIICHPCLQNSVDHP